MAKSVAFIVANLFVIMLNTERAVSSELPVDQVSAMTRIYEIFQNNTASSFVWSHVSKNSSPCLWKGVVCSRDNSSILAISFTSFSISTSEFLSSLCNIATLESIDVSNNRLTSIPDSFSIGCGVEISGLNLKLLNFSGNKLNGYLPNFSSFTALEKLDFSSNSLSGEISLQLDGLGSLKSLNLRWNNFTGKIPTNLKALEELSLSSNSFTGEIPVDH